MNDRPRIVGGTDCTASERFGAQCRVGIHPRWIADPNDPDLIGRCVACLYEQRWSDLLRPLNDRERAYLDSLDA